MPKRKEVTKQDLQLSINGLRGKVNALELELEKQADDLDGNSRYGMLMMLNEMHILVDTMRMELRCAW